MNSSIYRTPGEERMYRILACIFQPSLALRQLWLRFPVGSFRLRLAFDIFSRPHYAYGVFHAAQQARMLNIPRISVIEFGVASGNGLVALENVAEEVEHLTGVSIEVFGFDTGKGLPTLRDYRDLAYKWEIGEFAFDPEKVRKRLKRAKLILGDVSETVPLWCGNPSRAPLGFVAVDVDLYHSTVNALHIFEQAPEYLLPRVYTYLDDVIFTSKYLGEWLAVSDWNAAHHDAKIDEIATLWISRFFKHRWLAGMCMTHFFAHPLYNNHIGFLDHSAMQYPHSAKGPIRMLRGNPSETGVLHRGDDREPLPINSVNRTRRQYYDEAFEERSRVVEDGGAPANRRVDSCTNGLSSHPQVFLAS